MFAHVEGIISGKNKDSMVIDVGGIGFLLYVSGNTLSNTPRVGEKCKLYSILNVREDAMELFGFKDQEEKRMFERLRSVPGVGARTALAILSALSVRDLSIALVSGDTAALQRAQGVGKKLAQMLIVKLKDQIDDDDLTASAGVIPPDPQPGSAQNDATAALLALGYTSQEAARAVSAVAGQTDDVNQLIFQALRRLGG